ncbi:MAG: hypothetical protein CUN54_10445, partial [Phototrophicales bacterium]
YMPGDLIELQMPGENGDVHKCCPAVVVSGPAYNDNLETIIVCPCIHNPRIAESRIGVTHIPGEVLGLQKDYLVLSLQIKTVLQTRIVKRIGRLPASLLDEVRRSLCAVLDFDEKMTLS